MEVVLLWKGQRYTAQADPTEPLYAVAKRLSLPVGAEILAAKTAQGIHELAAPVGTQTFFQLVGWEDPEGKLVFWHSSAHLLAEAIQHFWPQCKLTIGPPIENGFYYDIDFGGQPPTPEDFPALKPSFSSWRRNQSTLSGKRFPCRKP